MSLLRRRSQGSKSRTPARARNSLAAASSPGRTPASARIHPAAPSPALPAASCAQPRPGSAWAPPRAPLTVDRGTPAPPSIPRHNQRSAPHAAPVHDGRHLPARHKRARLYFRLPIHTSYSHPHQSRPNHVGTGALSRPPDAVQPLLYLISASAPRNFCVARKRVFFAVSSVVCRISPTVRNFIPW